jgi:hypothetical protein
LASVRFAVSEKIFEPFPINPTFFCFGSIFFISRCSLLGRIPDKNDRCAFTRDSRGEVMIFFEKNKVLGVEPNRVLNILEGI